MTEPETPQTPFEERLTAELTELSSHANTTLPPALRAPTATTTGGGSAGGRRWARPALIAAALLVIAGLAAASFALLRDDAPERVAGRDPVFQGEAMALVAFRADEAGDCTDVLQYLRTEAAERVGPTDFASQEVFLDDPALANRDGSDDAAASDDGGDGAMAEDGEGDDGSASDDGGPDLEPQPVSGDTDTLRKVYDPGEPQVTGTNTQEADVDEPDLVKSDGRHIVSLVDDTLRVFDITSGEPVQVAHRLLATQGTRDLMLAGDRIFVFRQRGPKRALILELGMQQLDLRRTLEIEGAMINIRMVGAELRLAISTEPQIQLPGRTEALPVSKAIAANKDAIAEAPIDVWLPNYTITDGQGDAIGEGLAVGCNRLFAPQEFAGLGTLSVLTVDTSRDLTVADGAAVLAEGQTMYATTSSVYIATKDWEAQRNDQTDIHQFRTLAKTPVEYVASGHVPGTLLSQFSLDEHQGHLRVVSTIGREAATSLTVLRPEGPELVEVGSVGGLGRNERVFSVRLVGDRGYVVTFRQIDPFYVLDLSDPANPTVTGELEIPAFSTYLHPIDENLVLGVGEDGDPGRGPFTRRPKVSLFDVSDPAEPTELATWVSKAMDATLTVGVDHRAFQWLPDDKLAILPGSPAMVALRVDDETLIPVGSVLHDLPTLDTASACRVLPQAELDANPVLLRLQRGSGASTIMLCDPTDDAGYTGFECRSFDRENLRLWEQLDLVGLEIGADTLVRECRPASVTTVRSVEIVRTVVIDDAVWSLSEHRIQANALTDDLPELGGLDFP